MIFNRVVKRKMANKSKNSDNQNNENKEEKINTAQCERALYNIHSKWKEK